MLRRWRVLVAAAFFVALPGAALAARGYATNDVNLHAGPGVGYPVVDMIPAGAHIDIHGCLNDDSWCDVSWNGDRGWVAAAYLDYFYNNRYVYLPDYAGEIDVPVVTFTLGTYWANYYVGRPWYHRRTYWRNYWHHHHPHFVHNPHHNHHHFVAGQHNNNIVRNRRRNAQGPVVGGIHGHQIHHGHAQFTHHNRQATVGGHFPGHRGRPHFAGHQGRPHFATHNGAAHLGRMPGAAMHAHASAPAHIGGGHFGGHGGAPHFNGGAHGGGHGHGGPHHH